MFKIKTDMRYCRLLNFQQCNQFSVNTICNSMFETKQSVNQDFINYYSWIIRINHTIQVTLHTTIYSWGLKLVLSRLPEINSIFQFNSLCSARTNQDYKKRVQEEETQSILDWFTTQGYVQSSLHNLQRKFH